jgi:hypothetical protein
MAKQQNNKKHPTFYAKTNQTELIPVTFLTLSNAYIY